jgi:hypothetical protein
MKHSCYILASSVDAERAFSGGRLQVSHLQHNMKSQTFKAKVALRSWATTPLFPQALQEKIIENSMRKGAGKGKEREENKDKGKGKAKEVDPIEVSEDSGDESDRPSNPKRRRVSAVDSDLDIDSDSY